VHTFPSFPDRYRARSGTIELALTGGDLSSRELQGLISKVNRRHVADATRVGNRATLSPLAAETRLVGGSGRSGTLRLGPGRPAGAERTRLDLAESFTVQFGFCARLILT